MAGVIFVRTGLTEREPMLPLSLFQDWAFTGPALLGLLVNVAFYGLVFLFSLLLQKEDGFSALAAGLAFLPLAGSVFVTNLVSGRLSALVGSRVVILIGLAGMFVGCLGLLFVGPGAPFGELVVQQMILGSLVSAGGGRFTGGLHVALVLSMLLVAVGTVVVAGPLLGSPAVTDSSE
jgi:DHA2 family methylenomycin A resistance protein-like MFS transporter